jgi:hypothetical protein
VPRRDTNSLANHVAGARLFPGVQHLATFRITEDADHFDVAMRSHDCDASVHVNAHTATTLPQSSIFRTLEQASEFFRQGCRGWSPGSGQHLDGMCLQTEAWAVHALAVSNVHSSFFEDPRRFHPGSVTFDCALLMRDVPHRWVADETSLALSAQE